MASDPTVSRMIDALAGDSAAGVEGRSTRLARRPGRWYGNGQGSTHPPTGSTPTPLIIDIDATLVTAHSEKERRRRRSNAGSGSTRYWRSSTTARRAAASL